MGLQVGKDLFGRFYAGIAVIVGVVAVYGRVNKIGLMSFFKLLADCLIGIDFVAFFYKVSCNWLSSLRHCADCRNVQVPENRVGQGLGNRGSAHHKKVGLEGDSVFVCAAFCYYCLALHYAEAVLLVDYGQFQVIVDNIVGKKCVGSDYDIDFAVLKLFQKLCASGGFYVSREECDSDS